MSMYANRYWELSANVSITLRLRLQLWMQFDVKFSFVKNIVSQWELELEDARCSPCDCKRAWTMQQFYVLNLVSLKAKILLRSWARTRSAFWKSFVESSNPQSTPKIATSISIHQDWKSSYHNKKNFILTACICNNIISISTMTVIFYGKVLELSGTHLKTFWFNQQFENRFECSERRRPYSYRYLSSVAVGVSLWRVSERSTYSSLGTRFWMHLTHILSTVIVF